MKKVMQKRGWGIYILSPKEVKELGFEVAVIHPDVMGTGMVTARDTDMEMSTLAGAIEWVEHYNDELMEVRA